jgi:hypothetical protein
MARPRRCAALPHAEVPGPATSESRPSREIVHESAARRL